MVGEPGAVEHPVSAARIGEIRGEIRKRIPQAQKTLNKSGQKSGKKFNRAAINIAGDSYREDLIHQEKEKELKERAKQLEEEATFDKLTSLRNENGFEISVEEVVAQYQRDKTALERATGDPNAEPYEFVIAYLDVRGLKEKNDQSEDGHSKGDLFLQETGQDLRINTRETDTVARLHGHGDEFAILMRTSLEGARVWAEKFTRYEDEQGKKFAIGLAKLNPNDWESSLKNADAAQTVAKALSNKNSIENDQPVETQVLTYDEAIAKIKENPTFIKTYNSGR